MLFLILDIARYHLREGENAKYANHALGYLIFIPGLILANLNQGLLIYS